MPTRDLTVTTQWRCLTSRDVQRARARVNDQCLDDQDGELLLAMLGIGEPLEVTLHEDDSDVHSHQSAVA